MRKILISIILMALIIIPTSNVYAKHYSSSGFTKNHIDKLNEYLKKEGYTGEYVPTKTGREELYFETDYINQVRITKITDEYGKFYFIKARSGDLITSTNETGMMTWGGVEFEEGKIQRSTGQVPTTLEGANQAVEELFASRTNKFKWENNLVEGLNTFKWKKKVTITINEIGEDGYLEFDMDVYIEEATGLVQDPSYSSIDAPDENGNLIKSNVGTRYVRAEGAYKYEYYESIKEIKKVGTFSGGDELEIKNKFLWNEEEWCSIKNSDKYIKASDLREVRPTDEEIANAQKIDTPTNVENGFEEDYNDDVFDFSHYPGGVWMEDLGGSTIADPTNEVEVNTYNPNSETNLTEANSSKILSLGKTVIGILNVIATVVAVLVLTILGIKEEKAEYKETMMPYIIGAIFIFSSTTIVNIIYNFAMTFNK